MGIWDAMSRTLEIINFYSIFLSKCRSGIFCIVPNEGNRAWVTTPTKRQHTHDLIISSLYPPTVLQREAQTAKGARERERERGKREGKGRLSGVGFPSVARAPAHTNLSCPLP